LISATVLLLEPPHVIVQHFEHFAGTKAERMPGEEVAQARESME